MLEARFGLLLVVSGIQRASIVCLDGNHGNAGAVS